MIQAEILLIAPKTNFFLELEQLLTVEEIAVTWAETIQRGSPYLNTDRKHMVVLDCPPESTIHSLALSQEIGNQYSGLLVLVSGQDDLEFHSLALGSGVDASLTYSAGPSLLGANIQALLRRFVPQDSDPRRIFGNLILDSSRCDAFVSGQAVQLSTTEFQILWAIAQKPGHPVSRDELHRVLYKTIYNGYDRSIDLYVSRIRQKIGKFQEFSSCIKTVRGVGYLFMAIENG